MWWKTARRLTSSSVAARCACRQWAHQVFKVDAVGRALAPQAQREAVFDEFERSRLPTTKSAVAPAATPATPQPRWWRASSCRCAALQRVTRRGLALGETDHEDRWHIGWTERGWNGPDDAHRNGGGAARAQAAVGVCRNVACRSRATERPAGCHNPTVNHAPAVR